MLSGEFGDYALIIADPKGFIDSVRNYAKEKNITLEYGAVKYEDTSRTGEHKFDPFTKDEKYSHQKECRIVIKQYFRR